ncbi:MAG: thiamine biosynthesis protein ThiF [Fibrobacter sp.]|uniref:thiamine biosynthesis protein ThiF n=1 Tax=Fibrobacter sp. TaxID=35828 RepID=UPI0025C23915|nr:thiamine biosynthesis protein ThiF [Fibrobacter sp.]MBR4784799.1 thiamine biosynthesis protein ThiF [Fibrobacter sp.]
MDSRMPSREEMFAALEMRQGADAVRKLQAATVAVCGLGGLGSNIAISLARAGVGKLILVDFDCVDVTNLHRQQYRANQVGLPKPDALLANLKEIAPYTEYETYFEKLTAENAARLLAKADVICEAFDVAESKATLVNTVLETMPEKFLVAASGMAGYGSGNEISTRKVTKRFYVCGDGRSDVADGIGLIAPRVMLCAAHQALTAIRLILGQE